MGNESEQLKAATQFILQSKEESVNYKKAAEINKEVADEAINILREELKKKIPAEITEESFTRIYNDVIAAAKKGVTNTQCQFPDTTELVSSIANAVLQKISAELDTVVTKSVDRHKARVEVHHTHSLYGQFTSKEATRKMMVWLSSCVLVSFSFVVLCVLDWYKVVNWEPKYFRYFALACIAFTIIGTIVRLYLSRKLY